MEKTREAKPTHEVPVRAVLRRPAIKVHADDTLRDVARTLTEEAVGAVIVRGVHSGIAWGGLVSERDVVAAVAAGLHPDRAHASDVMTTDIALARPDEPLIDVTMRMLDNEIRHLPVVDGDVIVGVISARDALRVLAEEVRDGTDA